MRAPSLSIVRGWWRDLRSPTGPGVLFAVCRSCGLRHQLATPDTDARFADFANNHPGHDLDVVKVRNPDVYGELMALAPNADIKQAFQGAQTQTSTSLQSLARSVTAGWQMGAVTNTTNLYLDDLVQIVIAAVNTAPANGKVFYVLAGHSNDGGTSYTRPFSGTQGTCTYDAIDSLPQCAPMLGIIPYATQNSTLTSETMSMAKTAGYVMPERYTIGVVNDSGFTTAAAGNVVKTNGVYRTII